MKYKHKIRERKNENKKTKIALKITNLTILSMIILLLTPIIKAEIQITEVNAESTIKEGEIFTVTFTAETNKTNITNSTSINYEIYKGSDKIANTNSYEWKTNYYDSGVYTFTLKANDGLETDNKTITLTVQNNPLQIEVLSPKEETTSNTTIIIKGKSKQAESCIYEINNTSSGILTKQGTEYSKIINLGNGKYELTINCTNNEESAVKTINFEIDTNHPIITSSEPDNSYENAIIGRTATLEITTNEKSTCKYDIQDISYDSMKNTFSNTNTLQHYQELNSLTQGEHNYYIRCKDEYNNKMSSSKKITFYTNSRPTAKISIDKNPPLKAGTYKVTLTASENLIEEPTLSYNFHNSVSKKPITLTGSGREWSGYLIIDDSTPNSVGTFFYSGRDNSGLTGDEIIECKVFLVDTTPPPTISSFEVIQEGSNLKLQWDYSGEEINQYLIYRSTEPEVSVHNYYQRTSNKYFEDLNVDAGVTYYYKIRVEDKAGNTGSFSTQQTGKVEKELKEEGLDHSLTIKVDQKIKELDTIILDADWSLETLESEKNSGISEVINQLSLIPQSRSLKSNLESLKKELESLKRLNIDSHELEKRMEKIESSIKTNKAELIKSILINDKLEYSQVFDKSGFTKALNDYLLYKDLQLSEELKSKNQELQERMSVEGKIVVVSISYLNSDKVDKQTIITKTISLPEQLSEAYIVETIPKIVEDDADNIIFNFNPKILKKDPVVEWTFRNFNSETIYYIISKHVSLADAKQARTDLFIGSDNSQAISEDEDYINQDSNQITGMISGSNQSAGDSGEKFNFTFVIILLGVIIIGGLLAYYFLFLGEEEPIKNHLSPGFNREMMAIKPLPDKNFLHEHKQRYSASDSKTSLYSDINNLIDQADRFADEFQFEKVHKIYVSLLHLYEITNFYSGSQKQFIRERIEMVYSKILIALKIRDANLLMSNNDLESVKRILADLNLLLKMHENDKNVFYSYASKMYNRLCVSAVGLGGSL